MQCLTSTVVPKLNSIWQHAKCEAGGFFFFSFSSSQLHVCQVPPTAAAAAINISEGLRDLMWRPVKHGYLQYSMQPCAHWVLAFSTLHRPGGIYKSHLHLSILGSMCAAFIAHYRSQVLRHCKVCRHGWSPTVDWHSPKKKKNHCCTVTVSSDFGWHANLWVSSEWWLSAKLTAICASVAGHNILSSSWLTLSPRIRRKGPRTDERGKTFSMNGRMSEKPNT